MKILFLINLLQKYEIRRNLPLAFCYVFLFLIQGVLTQK